MNKNKAIGAALTGFAATGLIAALGMGSSLAAVAEQGTSDTDPVVSSTSSEVLTEEACTWYMLGAPSAISLAAGFESDGAGGFTTVPQEYVGQDLVVSSALGDTSDLSLNVYQSGNFTPGSATTTSECTFYSPTNAPVITFTVADTDFDATYGAGTADTTQNFTASETKPLSVGLVGQNCDAKWTVSSATSLYSTVLTGMGMTIADTSDVTVPAAADAGDRCVSDMTVSTTIPGGMGEPAAAGQTYTWTGPTLQIIRTTHTTDLQ